MPLSWISRDGKLLILARGMRSSAQGSIAVLMAIYLDQLGFSVFLIGVFLTSGVAGGALFAILIGTLGDWIGRRRLMTVFPVMSAGVGVTLILSDDVLLLCAVAFLGAFTTEGMGTSPMHPLEMASLAETVPQKRRTDLYAVFNIARTVGTALGALGAGLPDRYQQPLGLSEVDALKVMFVGYAVLTASTAIIYAALSPTVEVGSYGNRWVSPFRLPSRRLIFTLSGLFSIDNFASGLMAPTLVSYWFFTKFGIGLAPLGSIFFASNIITATSLWVSAKLSNRVGMLNIMVFPHGFAALVLILLPFLPWAWLAVLAFEARSFFGQMDIPPRDSYIMAIVSSAERTAMASMFSISRTTMQSASPSVATALWSTVSSTIPFVGSGALRLVYDILLYKMFRHIKPHEGDQRAPATARALQSPGVDASTEGR